MGVNWNELEASGLDEKKVKRLDRLMERLVKEAGELDILVFGGMGDLSLRFDDNELRGDGERKGRLIIANIGGDVDGGDGGNHDWGDEFIRGES